MRRLLITALLLCTSFAVWGFGIEPGTLRTRTTPLDVAGLHRPVRMAILSDVHAGAPHVDAAFLARVAEAVRATGPDLVVLLGDYVIDGVIGGEAMAPEAVAPLLGDFGAPTFAVIGNHDAWNDADRVERALEAAGIRVLRNEAVAVHGFTLAGLDDPWARGPDPGLLAGVEGPVIVAVHDPDVAAALPRGVDLVLAGHTHGGQVSVPGFGGPVQPTRRRYGSGLQEVGGQRMFVTTGIGTSILPVRIGVAPTVDLLVLE